MDEESAAHQIGGHMFTRIVLHDLMVDLCMRADDPLAEASQRATINLGVSEGLASGDTNKLLSQVVLHEFETFWGQVEREVGQRVARRGAK